MLGTLEAIEDLRMCGKNNVLKLGLNSLKRDAGAGEEPEFGVGLCYRASNCQDAEAGGAEMNLE